MDVVGAASGWVSLQRRGDQGRPDVSASKRRPGLELQVSATTQLEEDTGTRLAPLKLPRKLAEKRDEGDHTNLSRGWTGVSCLLETYR